MAQRPRALPKERKVSQTDSLPRRRASAPSPSPSDQQDREAKVAELRKAWLEGRLDLTVGEDAAGFERLLDDILER
jgi:hypothetical protein